MSVHQRLIFGVLLSVGLSWIAIFVWSYHAAEREVTEWDETRLIQLAPIIVRLDLTDLLALSRQKIDGRNEIVRSNHTPHRDSDYSSRFVEFEVVDRNGTLVARSTGFPSDNIGKLGDGHITERQIASEPWLFYAFVDDVTGRGVVLAEQKNQRSDLVTGAAAHIAKPSLIVLPISILLVWLSIGAGLRPLKALSEAVEKRNSQNLHPIAVRALPKELRPVVESTNNLLARLKQSMAHERAFTADAAHQLKTPLAAIKVQAQVALSLNDPEQQRIALERVVLGVDRAARLVEQLLLLARLDEGGYVGTSRFNLSDVVSESIDALRHVASRRRIVLSFERPAAIEIDANRLLVRAMIDNLLDNGVKHGNHDGTVRVSVESDGDGVNLRVVDDGPGVLPDERARLTDRFFRSRAATAAGSGLGLAVVSRIAAHCNASVVFDSVLDHKGLSVTVRFPLPTTSAPEQGRAGSAMSRAANRVVADV